MTTPDILAARQLEKSGMTRSEAEAVVGLMRTVTAPLATNEKVEALGESLREEMKAMEKAIRKDMKSMEERLRAEMNTMESRLLWKMAGMNLTMVGLVIATMRFLPS